MSTERIAEFVVKTGYEQIPSEAVTLAKKLILDCLAAALAGSATSTGRMITEFVRESGGKAEAGVIAGGIYTSASQAALSNGTMAHALDYDDTSFSWLGHPTGMLLPALLALGERGKVSGQRILEAYLLGYEVGAKIGQAMVGRLLDKGWHQGVIVGTIAATAAAAKLLGLGVQQTTRAMGIAGSEAGGMRLNFGTDTKPFHAGNASRSGVVAALLAEKGFTASESILEGALGLYQLFGEMEADVTQIAQGLGSPWDIVSVGVATKPYPSCHGTHASIDAMLHLIKEHHLHAEDVVEIECRASALLPQMLLYARPQTGLQGKFSMQYCLAAALLDGEVTIKQFTDEKVLAPQAQELILRVKYAHPYGAAGEKPEEILSLPQKVVVRLRDGREYSHEVIFAKGNPKNPMNWGEVAFKFRHCAQPTLSAKAIDHCIELISDLESVKDIAELMEMVVKVGTSPG